MYFFLLAGYIFGVWEGKVVGAISLVLLCIIYFEAPLGVCKLMYKRIRLVFLTVGLPVLVFVIVLLSDVQMMT